MCKLEKLQILGIEAFKLSDKMVIPEPDLIADFSEMSLKQWDIASFESVHEADLYFGKIKDRTELYFDFTFKKRQ